MPSFFRVIWACTRKDLKSVLTERAFLFQCLILPLNYNLLLILFALAGSNAPTAVVLQDQGPAAQAMVQALASAHSFRLVETTARMATQQIQHREIVALVTIPANFDLRVAEGNGAQINLVVNNLNTDMTDDVRRGVRLALTTFAATINPTGVTIGVTEQDQYTHDLDYIPFLSVSALVIGIMVGGLLLAGNAAVREREQQTMTQVLLSPAPRTAIAAGKMLAAGLVSLVASLVSLTFVVLVIGDWPASWDEVLLFTPLAVALFVAAGTLLGTLVRRRQTLTLLVRGCSVPLFFLSGIFAPISFSTPAVQAIARLFPVHYLLVLEQSAFFGLRMNTLSMQTNLCVLIGFLILPVGGCSLALGRRMAAREGSERSAV